MKSTGSVVTYLIFEFSFQHVLLTRIRVHSAYTVHTLSAFCRQLKTHLYRRTFD